MTLLRNKIIAEQGEVLPIEIVFLVHATKTGQT